MTETMRALVYDRERDPWDASRGLRLAEIPKVTLDEKSDYHDRSRVLDQAEVRWLLWQRPRDLITAPSRT